jgi:diguanylate cyclase (GGDEF)-like protein/PAS domain S-box-containing protein
MGIMAERSLETCLALCKRAQELTGDAQAHTLAELRRVLEQFTTLFHQDDSRGDETHSKLHIAEADIEPLFKLDLTGYVTEWSERAERMFGYHPSEVIGSNVLMLYADEDEEIAELFLEEGKSVMEVLRRKKTGDVFRAALSMKVLNDKDNEPLALEIYLTEIFDRLSDEEKLRLHARIIEDSDQGILITDAKERIVSINRAFTRITGYTSTEAIGQTPDILRSGLHDANFRAEVRAAMRGSGPWQGEIIGRRKNGEIFPQSVTISVVRNEDHNITHAFSIFSDISRHKEAEVRLQRLANYDTVTGLPNRSLLNQLLGQALTTARRSNDHGALMMILLNRLSSINQTLGHEIGNKVLCNIVTKFRETLRDEDVLARVDGDKLVVALLHIDKREHAAVVAHKLLSTLHVPMPIDGQELHNDACIGIAIYPEDSMDAGALIGCADVAMTRVQQSGESGFLFYASFEI